MKPHGYQTTTKLHGSLLNERRTAHTHLENEEEEEWWLEGLMITACKEEKGEGSVSLTSSRFCCKTKGGSSFGVFKFQIFIFLESANKN